MEPFELYRISEDDPLSFIRVYTDGAKLWSPDINADKSVKNKAVYGKHIIDGVDWFLPPTNKTYFGAFNNTYTKPYSVYTTDSGVELGTSAQLEAAFLDKNGVPIANSAYVKQQIAIKNRRNTLNDPANLNKQLLEAIQYQNQNQEKLVQTANQTAEALGKFFKTIGYTDQTTN